MFLWLDLYFLGFFLLTFLIEWSFCLKIILFNFTDVTEDEYGGEEASSRKGRFRVTSSSSSGPPETTSGRFRLTPQSMCILNLKIYRKRSIQLVNLICRSISIHFSMSAARKICCYSRGTSWFHSEWFSVEWPI